MRKIFLLGFITISFIGFSQTRDTSYIKVYSGSGYDFARDVVQLADSNFVITGSSSSFPSENADVLLMKVGHYGDVIWSNAYGGSMNDWGNKITELEDSTMIISGYTNSFGQGGFDFYLIKVDQTGTLIWSKTFGGANWDRSYSHVVVEDKDIVIVGETQSFGSGQKDIMVVRADSMGNEKWRKFYGGTEDDIANDIAYNPADSTLYLAGSTESFGNEKQGYLLKLDVDGDTIFTRTIGGGFDDSFNATKINLDNGEWVSCGYNGISEENLDFWFYSISPIDGSLNFSEIDGGNQGFNEEVVYSFDFRPTLNEIYYGGYTTSYGISEFDGNPDIFLGNRTSTGGWLTYFHNFGEPGTDDIRSLKWCTQNGIVAVGNTEFFSESENGIILIRIDFLKNFPTYNDNENIGVNSSISEYVVPNSFKIYPNPFKEQLNIEMTDLQSNTQVHVFTIDGKKVTSIELNNYETNIPTSEWKNGFYILQVTTKGNHVGSYRIMK